MPVVPFADFLAGSLLTLLMPVTLLIALVAWYYVVSVRVPKTAEGSGSSDEPAAASPGAVAPTPGPNVTEQKLPPEPGA